MGDKYDKWGDGKDAGVTSVGKQVFGSNQFPIVHPDQADRQTMLRHHVSPLMPTPEETCPSATPEETCPSVLSNILSHLLVTSSNLTSI